MDEEAESPPASADKPAVSVLLPTKAFLCSRKGQLLTAEVVLSFISFICFTASDAVSFMTVPLIEFLLAFFLFFAYSTKINEKFKGVLWPLMLFGFIATIAFALDFYLIFNDLAVFLKKDNDADEPEANRSADDDSDSDSD
ncbi:CKLF-like MARVEL transmembrane domain-containing protein 3 isoform X2 [Protopterus annectens]|uniref:CKLF-like MARVEL transmembrane domain-containing protein 3 isoform X2 n=1 Tax=Protopterus annectens TaxID=7888 RepID=UPI001CFA67B8|nr:CKLF-like MARVEL transmembrane domain-containing protein 3 isoform X2 [Protopterus annectens]